MKDSFVELLSTKFNMSKAEAQEAVDKTWRLMREEYLKNIVDIRDVKMGVKAKIGGSRQ